MMEQCFWRTGCTKSNYCQTSLSGSTTFNSQQAMLTKGSTRFVLSTSSYYLPSRASLQESHKKGAKQVEEPSPQWHKRQYHLFKRTAQSASGTKGKTLVEIVMSLSNVKEEIYSALDEWVAFEVEFPIIAVGKALKTLKHQQQWQRIIQVSKWMLSKGQGQTFGTYELLLRAFDMDARLEDTEALWEKLISTHTRSTPKSMFSLMMNIYKRRKMPRKLLEVFEQMENHGVKPDKDILTMVVEAYKDVGILGKENELMGKYPPARWKYYKSEGRKRRVPIS